LARLRPGSDADRAFLVELYGSTREEELDQIAWEPGAREAFVDQQFTAQDAHYRANYPGATLDVIELDGKRAGRLYVHRGRRDIRIMDIALAPGFRGRGVGTGLLRSLIGEAQESGRTLSIHVEANNPARALYERLGFRRAGEHGVYMRMEWNPASGTSPGTTTRSRAAHRA
jgi:ribosomal protein S18 acetylase RimI-like enzyme